MKSMISGIILSRDKASQKNPVQIITGQIKNP